MVPAAPFQWRITLARMNHLKAVPDEFQFEQEDDDPYFDVVNQDTHKFIYRDEETQKNLKQHNYHTKASNEFDHSVPVNFRVPPDMAARMKYLAEHDAIKRTRSALWRDAGHWYIAFMEKMLNDETFTEDMRLTLQQAEVEYFESVTFQRTHLVESQTAAIQRAMDAKDWTRLPIAIAAGHKVVAESTVDTEELKRVLREAESRLEQQ